MKAMILSAGLGSRMLPLTKHTPKPLLKVNNKSLIVWHIEKLASLGFKEIIINIAHLAPLIPKALGNGEKWNINILYSDESNEGMLESAGGIIKALPLLGEETFLVVNGDVWSDYIFNPVIDLKSKLAHLIMVKNPEHNLLGDFFIDKEKFTFSGIGYYHPDFFKYLKYGKQALGTLLKRGIAENTISLELYKGEWSDIGTPERLKEINRSCI